MGATTRPLARNVFSLTDAMDVENLVSLFATDGRVVFGNGQPMVGVDEIRTGTYAFYDTIASLHHDIVKEWNISDDTIIELKVTYGRKDGQRSPSRASRSSIPTPQARSTTTACTSIRRPSMPDRRAQTRP